MRNVFWERERQFIKASYSETWDYVEDFWKEQFRHFLRPPVLEILAFIWSLRELGYDRELAAHHMLDVGDGLLVFMLSRSASYGLRDDQPQLAFVLIDENQIDIRFTALNVNYIVSVEHLEFTLEIEHLLSLLLAHPID